MFLPRAAVRARAALLSCLLSVAAGGAAAATPDRDVRSVSAGDWLGTCDERLDCTVMGFARGDSPIVLRLDRPRSGTTRGALLNPGGGAPILVQLLLPRRPEPVGTVLRTVPGADPDLPRRGTLSTAETTAVLAVLRGGGRMRFVSGGPHPGTRPFALLRLAGAVPVLDWIAERQHHLPEPPAPVPHLPLFDGPRPDLARPPAPLLALPETSGCERDADPDGVGARDLQAWRLDMATTLWAVPCGSDNFSRSTLFLLAGADGSAVRPVAFPDLSPDHTAPTGLLDNAVVDPDGRRIDSLRLGRGLGDCGQARSFAWDGSGFRLLSDRLMPLCRGLPPADWPLVYSPPAG